MFPRNVWITGVSVIVLAIAAGIGLSFLRCETIRTGVRIAGVDLSGLTTQEAEKRLAPVVSDHSTEHVTLRYSDQTFDTTFGEIGGDVDVKASVRAAYLVGRHGSIFKQIAEIVSARRSGHRIPVMYSFNKDTALSFLKTAASRIDQKPTDAKLVVEGDSISTAPERPGIKLDLSQSLRQLMHAANSGARDISLVVVTDEPEVKEADLQGINGVLASYSTKYVPGQRDRSHNLLIACRAINGTLVKPGEVFSYNKEVGPRLKKFGFRDALMFVDGQVEPGTGGGVCQVSTTIYNAALLADMKILRRSHHSRPVVYAPVGRDATVAYPVLDLRFRNTSDAPIYVSASLGSHTVNVNIFGAKKDGYQVALESAGHEVIKAPVTRVIDDKATAPTTSAVVREKGRPGHRVSTYRIVKLDGKVVKRELISTDYYRPESRVLVVPKSASTPVPM